MHHLYNSNDYTIDSTFSLNSNLNWVTLRYDMHELFISESSVYCLITASNITLLDLTIVPPKFGTYLSDFNSVKLN